MKTLIVGGVHGDELTGISLVKHFLKRPTNKFAGLLCHPEAIKKEKRFFETDLNRSFSVKIPISLEENIARKLEKSLMECDFILDFHNTKADRTTCVIIVGAPNKWHFRVASHFGFKKMVSMEPSGSLISLNPSSSISLEIANNDKGKYPEKSLIEKIEKLHDVEVSDETGLEYFKYVTQVKSTTLNRIGIASSEITNFVELTREQKQKLGLPTNSSMFPIFAKKEFSEELGFVVVKRYSFSK